MKFLPDNPICRICSTPVPLESSKTDEHGGAVHETCYVDSVVSATRAVERHPIHDFGLKQDLWECIAAW